MREWGRGEGGRKEEEEKGEERRKEWWNELSGGGGGWGRGSVGGEGEGKVKNKKWINNLIFLSQIYIFS